MTDNEVVKYLESTIRRYKDATHHVSCIVDINMLKAALDLINRQKAEIERLKDELHRAKVEISKHFDYMNEAANEAIEVFANSLKIKLNRTIDNLVKERTEVSE